MTTDCGNPAHAKAAWTGTQAVFLTGKHAWPFMKRRLQKPLNHIITMRTIIISMLAALAMLLPNVASANTGDYKAIPVDRLPAVALQTIKAHMAGRKVAIAKVKSGLFSKEYTVIFTNGEKIEFDGHGKWTEVKCKRSAVPASLVPQQIARYISSNYPDCRILEIERDEDEYEVKLSNYVEVTFDSKFNVIDID